MIGTYILYLSISLLVPLIIKMIVGRRRRITSAQWLGLMLVLLPVSVIIGGRYEVGTDFPNYVDYYKSYLNGYSTFDDVFALGNGLEPGYLFLNWLGSKLGLSVSMFFTLISFFSFLLLLNAQKERAFLWPLVFFFFMGQMFGVSVNIVRQACAIFLFFYAVQYVGEKKIKLFLLITACVLLHYSSIVLYLVMFIDSKWLNFLDNPKLVVLTFILTWFFASYILPIFMQIMPLGIFSDKYLQSLEEADLQMEVGSGLGILATKTIDILLIWYSDKVRNFYNDRRLVCLYRIFFVGIIMTNIMGISIFLSRLFLAMVMMRIFVLAFATYYFLKQKDIRLLFGIFIIMLTTLQFIIGIRSGYAGISPYKFLWQ